MRKIAIVATFSLALSSCAIFTVDRSNAPGMDLLVGKSFIVAQDSFLIENSCLKEYIAKRCLLIQAVGGHIQYFKSRILGSITVSAQLPKSLAAYKADPSSFNGKYASKQGIFSASVPLNVVGTIPKGTVITITRLVSKPVGAGDRCWVVYGRLAGQDEDTAIEIPACWPNWGGPVERQPYWFTIQCPKPSGNFRPGPDNYTLPPVPKTAYLTPLSKATATVPQGCPPLQISSLREESKQAL